MISSISRTVSKRAPTTGVAVIRTFSSLEHKPLIDLHGLQARYANATYVAASKQNILDKVEAELLTIQEMAGKSQAFKSFLENPLTSRDEKTSKVQTLLGDKSTSVTLNLMTTLAGNARLAETSKIVDTYVKLMKAKRGEVEATIISAEPLTKAQTEAVATAMKSQVGSGKTVVLSSKIEPSILGGLQVQIGDQFLDLSVGSKIDAISRTVV